MVIYTTNAVESRHLPLQAIYSPPQKWVLPTEIPPRQNPFPIPAYKIKKARTVIAINPHKTGIKFLRTSSAGLALYMAATGMTDHGITVLSPTHMVIICPSAARRPCSFNTRGPAQGITLWNSAAQCKGTNEEPRCV